MGKVPPLPRLAKGGQAPGAWHKKQRTAHFHVRSFVLGEKRGFIGVEKYQFQLPAAG